MKAVASAYGWRAAGLCAALVGISALGLIVWTKEFMHYPLLGHIVRHGQVAHSSSGVRTWILLRSSVVLLAFGFFFFVTFGFGALQNFAPSLLGDIYGLSIASSNSAFSIYLLAGCGGLLIGGFMASGRRALEYLVAGAVFIAVLIALLLGWGVASSALAVPLMGTMGFFVGLAGPSRDMLVRTAAKARFGEAAFGRVYGFVYSGLDVGLALAPITFGFLLDQQRPDLVFVGIAVTLACAIIAALSLGRQSTKLQAH